MDFILIHSKAEETISAFSLEMLTRCFCENAKRGTHSRLCVGVKQLDSGLDGLPCLSGSALVLWWCFVFQVRSNEKSEVGQ